MQKSTSFWVQIVAVLFVGLGVRAQAPTWQTVVAISALGTGSAYSNAAATDAAGNVYVAGQFSGTVSLGTATFISAAGTGNNSFLAKWNPVTSNFIWVRQLEGTATSVAVSGSSVYVGGYFSGTASFGNLSLTSAGDADAFVVKLVDTGSTATVAWAQRAGGPGFERAWAVAASGSGVYVAGHFSQAAAFGTTTLTTSGVLNGFVTKLVDNGGTGAFTWAQAVVSSGTSSTYGLAVAGSSVYLVGQFTPAAQFGTITLSTGAQSTAYVAKLVDAGASSSFSWAQAPTASGSTMYAGGIVVVGTSVYTSGRFTGVATFGTQTLTSAGSSDGFVAKLVDNGGAGSYVWSQQLGGPSDDTAAQVAVASNRVYVTGSFRSTANFGLTTLTSQGSGDLYVAALTDSGPAATFTWAQQAGGPSNDNSQGLALSGAGPVVVGSFNATASFGPYAITNAALYSESAYLALLGPDVLATTSVNNPVPVALYPNPAHGTATVRVPASAGTATLTLLDALGRLVRTAAAPTGRDYPLDLTGLMPGMYVLQVQAGEVVATRPLVVE